MHNSSHLHHHHGSDPRMYRTSLNRGPSMSRNQQHVAQNPAVGHSPSKPRNAAKPPKHPGALLTTGNVDDLNRYADRNGMNGGNNANTHGISAADSNSHRRRGIWQKLIGVITCSMCTWYSIPLHACTRDSSFLFMFVLIPYIGIISAETELMYFGGGGERVGKDAMSWSWVILYVWTIR
jgi:hypothetical protein